MLIKEAGSNDRINNLNIHEFKFNKSKIKNLNKETSIPKEVIENFPFKNPGAGQLEIITEILNAIKKRYKFIILEAGMELVSL